MGMTDREKIINGLYKTINAIHSFVPNQYWYDTETPCNDAITLLKAQEPRVMTLEEVISWQKKPIVERDPIYVEYREGKGFGAPHWAQDNFGFNVASCRDNYRSGAYGMLIRCWTFRPTDEQRMAVKWDG